MRAVIMGCGRVGAMVATRLSAAHDVTVIDWNPDAFDRLGDEYAGETVVGNGMDLDVLRAADIDSADVFLALTDQDNRNLMAAQIARSLGVEKPVARVYDATRSDIFADMGLMTFSPTVNGARRLFALLTSDSEGS